MSDKRRELSKRNKHAPKYSFHSINDLIHQQWPRLTYEEVETYRTDYERFCEAVKGEYGISHSEIEHQLELMRRENLHAA